MKLASWKIRIPLCYVLTVFMLCGQLVAEEPTANTEFNNATSFREAPKSPPPDAGRKKKSNGAVAAAIVGAAVAGAMCAMLLAEARKHPPGSKERSRLMQQAAQQCAQAAQNAANAGQNDDGSKQLTSEKGEVPDLASLGKARGDKQDKAPSLRNLGNEDQPQAVAANNTGDSFVPEPDIELPETPTIDDGFGDTGNVLEVGGPPSVSTLDPVAPAKLTFDEESEGGGPSAPPGPGGARLVSNSGELDFDELNNQAIEEALAAIDSEVSGRRKKKVHKGKAREALGGENAGGGAAGNEDADFNELMNAFMGGGSSDSPLAGGVSNQVLNLRASGNGPQKPKINIFQYASYRYKKLAYKKAKIKTRISPTKPKKSATQARLFR